MGNLTTEFDNVRTGEQAPGDPPAWEQYFEYDEESNTYAGKEGTKFAGVTLEHGTIAGGEARFILQTGDCQIRIAQADNRSKNNRPISTVRTIDIIDTTSITYTSEKSPTSYGDHVRVNVKDFMDNPEDYPDIPANIIELSDEAFSFDLFIGDDVQNGFSFATGQNDPVEPDDSNYTLATEGGYIKVEGSRAEVKRDHPNGGNVATIVSLDSEAGRILVITGVDTGREYENSFLTTGSIDQFLENPNDYYINPHGYDGDEIKKTVELAGEALGLDLRDLHATAKFDTLPAEVQSQEAQFKENFAPESAPVDVAPPAAAPVSPSVLPTIPGMKK